MRTFIILGLVASLGACSSSPTPPAEVVAEATRILLTDTEWPAKGDEPTRWLKEKVLVPIDATPNADTDWMIDPGQSQQAGMLCGTGGCELQIWSRSASGQYVPVFVSRVRELKTENKDGKYRLKTDYHGSYCGLTGAEPCPASFLWKGDIGRLGTDPEIGFHNEAPESTDPDTPPIRALSPEADLPQ